MSLNVDQAFGSQEVQKYYFPNFTRDKATAYLEGRPPRSFLIRRSSTQPGHLTFVISYVKSSGVVNHHRLFYQRNMLTPEGSSESFANVFQLLNVKGFIGDNEWTDMGARSSVAPPTNYGAPMLPKSAPSTNYVNMPDQKKFVGSTPYGAFSVGGHSGGSVADVKNPNAHLAHVNNNEEYGVLQFNAPTAGNAVGPPQNYGAVSSHLGVASEYTDVAVQSANAAPETSYTSMPSLGDY
mmetsp:Transcript_4215/g.6850  ORF Transcript_4215/g.6850 Transcript_4215/m.6850 type:complete len:238 (+) Transcript_4215:53-766(+)